ncbi:MAG: DUF5658 family protein [Bacteroidota bacterium]|nr:DUF5658 family protein [Bacteroidota bacterium]
MEKYPTTGNRRHISDRRFYQRFSFQHFIFGGRRKTLRRTEDKQGLKFVDGYNPALMRFIVLLLILSIIDGFMILYLLDHGVYEINPIMAFCLDFGPWFFLTSKFLLTCFGATCLLVVSNSHVFGDRIQVRDVFPAMLVLYLMVMVWNSFLYVLV